jgi:hypothetical protein
MTMTSPSRTTPIGPPFAASGQICPIRIPCETPENLPSVMRGQWDQTLVVRLLGRPLMVIVKLRKALDCGEVLLV